MISHRHKMIPHDQQISHDKIWHKWCIIYMYRVVRQKSWIRLWTQNKILMIIMETEAVIFTVNQLWTLSKLKWLLHKTRCISNPKTFSGCTWSCEFSALNLYDLKGRPVQHTTLNKICWKMEEINAWFLHLCGYKNRNDKGTSQTEIKSEMSRIKPKISKLNKKPRQEIYHHISFIAKLWTKFSNQTGRTLQKRREMDW